MPSIRTKAGLVLLSVGMLMASACSCAPVPKKEAIPSAAQQPEILSKAPEEGTIGEQIVRNWNVARGEECAGRRIGLIELRIHLDRSGAVTQIDPVNLDSADHCAVAAYDSAKRAVMISSPIELPEGKYFPTIRLRFHPDEVAQ